MSTGSAASGGAKVYTIAAGAPFVDALAAGLLAEAAGDPLALARMTVLLPTRRACRSLREAFLRASGGAPCLLPRLSPLGDIDVDELELVADEALDPAAGSDLPDAISGLGRQLLLAQAIQRMPDLAATPAQAVRLAGELGRLIDQVETERLNFEALARVVPVDYAAHWQVTLRFLEIVTARWPDILAERGVIDGADRRNRLLGRQAAAWERRPPADPIIAAGSTGSIPATADLLAVVARLPHGAVVLPGLDQEADEATWARLEETHPQHGLARLLSRLGVDRHEVRPWPAGPAGAASRIAPAGRARLVGEAMRPAETTEAWRTLGDDRAWVEPALAGLVRVDCPGAEEEAGVIALLMRGALETPAKTACLVTPDRALARRVAASLQRWGVEIDDSAGRPLLDTAVGTYLRLVAACAAERCAPLALLALLKHPLAAGGLAPPDFRARVRRLERAALRGPRPSPGFAGLVSALEAAPAGRFDRASDRALLVAWVGSLAGLLEPGVRALAGPPQPLAVALRHHVGLAEALAASDEGAGAHRLWQGEDGEAAARFVSDLLAAAADGPEITGADYPALFATLAAPVVVRPSYGSHPRLRILGPLEARLQSADLVILGGLNEGTWPAEPAADPWLSRPMRKAFGLPGPERRIGQAAHDFAQLACAPHVVLTRAERVDGTPTVPSRWLARLSAVLDAAGLDDRIDQSGNWVAWAEALDRPAEVRPVPPPAPRPPLAARPRRLSVTEIETWMRDPYALYAKRVLGLVSLDPIEADPGAAERGQFIHAALDRFVKAHPEALPPNAVEELLRHGREAIGDTLAVADVFAFWWPRFRRIAAWFVEFERERRATCRPLATEVRAELEILAPGGLFTLVAKADRIDRRDDGALAIIDYKTGAVPKEKDVCLGFAPQLPLEAMLAMAGAFEGIPAAAVGELAFWKLTGGTPPGEVTPLRMAPATLAERAEDGLRALIAAFDDPTTPYPSCPRPDKAPRYSDYGHLARVAEWSAGGPEAEE